LPVAARRDPTENRWMEPPSCPRCLTDMPNAIADINMSLVPLAGRRAWSAA
jgi:hypothetical protein